MLKAHGIVTGAAVAARAAPDRDDYNGFLRDIYQRVVRVEDKGYMLIDSMNAIMRHFSIAEMELESSADEEEQNASDNDDEEEHEEQEEEEEEEEEEEDEDE